MYCVLYVCDVYLFCNDTSTPEIYTDGHTLALHDALPIVVCHHQARHQEYHLQMSHTVYHYQVLRAGCRGHHLQLIRSEEHTSELQSLMRISYAVFCLKKKRCSNIIAQDRQSTRMKHLKENTSRIQHNHYINDNKQL